MVSEWRWKGKGKDKEVGERMERRRRAEEGGEERRGGEEKNEEKNEEKEKEEEEAGVTSGLRTHHQRVDKSSPTFSILKQSQNKGNSSRSQEYYHELILELF